tara:strand:- start:3127 stop:5184 length:2058 start_codon:yes stop_codon:yes gene_type:complete
MRTIIVNTEGPRGSAGPVGPQGNPGPSGSGGFLFPETYGASGDGITNDTNALQNVFSASRSTQTPVYLKNIYHISESINVTDTVVYSGPLSKIIANTTDFVLFATGSRSLRYDTTHDILRGHSTASINPITLSQLNLKQGDLIKVTSDRAFNTGSGEGGKQGEIQRVFETGSSGDIKIYGFWEDTYLSLSGANISKITSGKFETVGVLNIEQGGQSNSQGIQLQYLDSPRVDVKITNAIERSLQIIDCYAPVIHVNNYGANKEGTGYGVSINNANMYGTFSGKSESNRHSITFGTNSDRGVGWGNKIINFTGKSHTSSSIFDSHATCGSVYFNNCTAIGGTNRHGEPVPSAFPNGFSIEGRTTYITNCNVKDCYGGALTGDYNGIQEIHIKGLNLENCTIGFSAVGTEVERLTVEDINIYNSTFDANSIGLNISSITSSFVNIKNCNTYNIRCGINLNNNNLINGLNEFRIENLKTIYSIPSSETTGFYSALRLYDDTPVTLTNCETNAPRLLITDNGLNLKQLNLSNCKVYDSYNVPILLQSPIENLNIQNCYFSGSQENGYFLQANIGANIADFTFVNNTLVGDGAKIRGAYIHPSNTFTNFFDSGNNLSIATPISITSTGKQPTYWIIEGNIHEPLKLKGTSAPEGVVTANIGTMFVNLSGGSNTTLFIKESGTGNTGWVGI